MSEGFARQLRTATDPLWKAIHAHPFVTGIGDGSLPHEPFAYYLAQDYVYLDGFSRVLAVGAAKAHGLDDMRRLSQLLHATLEGEMDLHRRTCRAFGIDDDELEDTAPALVTTAYTSFLLRSCHEGGFEDVVTVLLPCAAGYVEIARALRERGLPDDPHYRDWIETYTDPGMVELVDWLVAQVDAVGTHASEASKARWHGLYETSARFELLFFDMAWNQETWPEVVPA